VGDTLVSADDTKNNDSDINYFVFASIYVYINFQQVESVSYILSTVLKLPAFIQFYNYVRRNFIMVFTS